MLQTGAISGRVRNRLDQPLGNVEVQALRATYPDGRRVLTSVQSAFSDDRGEFRLFWLPPGRYYLSARHPDIGGSLMRFGGGGGMFVGGGGIGPNGAPQFQEFRVSGDNAAASPPLETRQPSRARERTCQCIFPGGTDEQASAAIEVAPGGEQAGIDFYDRARSAAAREGASCTSRTASRPCRRVQSISSTGASAPTSDNLLLGPRTEGILVECCNGTFELGLPPGSYTLVAANNNINARVGISVGYADLDGVLIPLGQSFSIAGRVTFEERAPAPPN
jgi:hypothetical protein